MIHELRHQGLLISMIACGYWGRAFFGVVSQSFTVKDFGGVETGAVEHVGDFVNIWEDGEASHEVEDLADVLEDLLRIEIGGLFEDRLDEVQQSLFNCTPCSGQTDGGMSTFRPTR